MLHFSDSMQEKYQSGVIGVGLSNLPQGSIERSLEMPGVTNDMSPVFRIKTSISHV